MQTSLVESHYAGALQMISFAGAVQEMQWGPAEPGLSRPLCIDMLAQDMRAQAWYFCASVHQLQTETQLLCFSLVTSWKHQQRQGCTLT